MAKYEATAPITLIAGASVASGLEGKLVQINSSGQAVLPTAADSDAPVVGVFAQDEMTSGEPVTINQLQGKVTMVSAAAITAGHIVSATAVAAKAGQVSGSADFSADATGVGIALTPAAAADTKFQVLAIPYGTVG